jgi:hypothetical protein
MHVPFSPYKQSSNLAVLSNDSFTAQRGHSNSLLRRF